MLRGLLAGPLSIASTCLSCCSFEAVAIQAVSPPVRASVLGSPGHDRNPEHYVHYKLVQG